MDILEENLSEEIDPDLNEDEDIIMEDSREKHWRDVDKDGEDNSSMHSMGWGFYTRENS